MKPDCDGKSYGREAGASTREREGHREAEQSGARAVHEDARDIAHGNRLPRGVDAKRVGGPHGIEERFGRAVSQPERKTHDCAGRWRDHPGSDEQKARALHGLLDEWHEGERRERRVARAARRSEGQHGGGPKRRPEDEQPERGSDEGAAAAHGEPHRQCQRDGDGPGREGHSGFEGRHGDGRPARLLAFALEGKTEALPPGPEGVAWLVLDTSLLLGGKDPPRGPSWATTPEAAAEVKPGGKDARRYDAWITTGLQVRSATQDSIDRVEEIAMAAGNLGRLSDADLSLAALALDLVGTLITDDYTLLDVARRLNIPTQTVNTAGIERTLDFRPRCIGCGRWFDAMPKAEECPVCGSPVKSKPWKADAGKQPA
jgi:UPF0271 protein